ncbi:MAG: glycerol-3-phosphate 1-O-acyltransferase PlsY [Terriglobia bacterium]
MTAATMGSVLLAYLLGAIPFGYLLVKLRRGEDVRTTGSGSIGATNVARAQGPLAGLVTLLLDVAKGYLAVWVAAELTSGDTPWMAAAGLAAIVGHIFPLYLGFRGGKGVATGLGVFLHFTPWAVASVLAVWLVVVAIWRYVSLGSILAAATYPIVAYVLYRPALAITLAAMAGASLIIIRHASNIAQLVAGSEPKLDWRRKA